MSVLDNAKTIEIAGKTVARIDLNGEKIWELISYKNWVLYSVEADGTPYNNGLGYKNGYRVRSSGAETTSEDTVCTGFIPYKAGDILEIYSPIEGAFTGGVSYINVSDGTMTNIGQIATNGKYGIFNNSESSWSVYVSELSNGVRRFVVPTTMASANSIAFVRVTVGFPKTNVSGEGMIITVNEEIS